MKQSQIKIKVSMPENYNPEFGQYLFNIILKKLKNKDFKQLAVGILLETVAKTKREKLNKQRFKKMYMQIFNNRKELYDEFMKYYPEMIFMNFPFAFKVVEIGQKEIKKVQKSLKLSDQQVNDLIASLGHIRIEQETGDYTYCGHLFETIISEKRNIDTNKISKSWYFNFHIDGGFVTEEDVILWINTLLVRSVRKIGEVIRGARKMEELNRKTT